MIRAFPTANDLSPLQRRLGALFVLRLLLAGAVIIVAVAAPHSIVAPRSSLIPIVAIYLLLVIAIELARQWRGTVPPFVVAGAILTDGVFIAGTLTLAGGPTSGLSFLLYIHLIAVTLLASYRTGLKIAVWQSLLLIASHYMPQSVTGVAPLSAADAVLAVVAFLTVAVATAVCSGLNERELRRSRSGFKSLAEMTGRLEEVMDPDEVIAVLLASLPRAFTTARAAVVLLESRTVTVMARGRLQQTVVPADAGLEGVVARCATIRRPALVKRLDPVRDAMVLDALPGARNLVVLPFAADGSSLGVVVVEHGGRWGATISSAAVTLLAQFTVHAALAYRNVRLMAEVQHLATVDGLTGLTNRSTFEAALQREVARAIRTGEDLSLVLLDVDHFKAINDNHGHPVGDEVLRHVGRVLAKAGREFDLPARYGGEEFVVILPGCAGDEAVRVAERLRSGIGAGDGPLPVTASAGVAALHRNAMDAESLVRAADAALYKAKVSGRDRTVAAENRLRAVVA